MLFNVGKCKRMQTGRGNIGLNYTLIDTILCKNPQGNSPRGNNECQREIFRTMQSCGFYRWSDLSDD